MQLRSFALAPMSAVIALAFAAGLPSAANAQVSTPAPGSGALDVWFKAPLAGRTVSGVLNGGTACYVNGSGVSRVEFFIDSTRVNSDTTMSNGMQCVLDTTKFSNGSHTLTAVAYNASGASRKDVISINIQNSATAPTPPANTAPTVSLSSPAAGSTVAGTISYAANATDNAGVARVEFSLDGNPLASDATAPYGGSIDTTRLSNGPHTLVARAFDAAGLSTSTQVSFNVLNAVAQPTPPAPTPTPANTPAPGAGSLDVWFKAPTAGRTVSGVLGGSSCYVAGTGVSRVVFQLDGTTLNTDTTMSDGMQCALDTTKFANGSHTLTATAYNASGASRKDIITINIQNPTSGGGTPSPAPANAAPTVSITSPAAGATISGTAAACAATASDDKGVASVAFALNGTAITTDTSSPYACSIDTTKFANGTYNLTATARDADGATSTATRTVTVANSTTPPPTSGSGGAIASTDIVARIRQDIAFSQQSGASGQVIGTHPSISSIPETGIHHSTLPNGETLRLGKQNDPTNGARKALVFQVAPSDPTTSGSKRSEFQMPSNIHMNETYWVAYQVFIPDWGTLPSGDESLFGSQVHSSDHGRGLSPSYTTATFDGRSFRFSVQYSTSSSPTPSNTTSLKFPSWSQPGIPIPFGRWVEFVFQFRHSMSSSGFFRAWMDGQQLVNYAGPMGYNTPGYIDYMKFGYYNWSSFKTSRKVMMRSPIVVRDSGGRYTVDDMRTWVQAQP